MTSERPLFLTKQSVADPVYVLSLLYLGLSLRLIRSIRVIRTAVAPVNAPALDF